ncbi:MAG: hypothetical protein U0L61_02470 [Alistipes sp.]|nr:hypothetical protein [Alistipes sp.]
MNLIRIVKNILLIALVCIIAYSYHPNNFDISGEVISNSYIKYAALILIALYTLSISAFKETLSNTHIRNLIILTGCIFINFFLLYAVGLTNTINEIRSILICLSAVIIGGALKLNNNDIVITSLSYIIAVLFIGYLQISQNIGNFIIEDTYINTAKNAFGPMIAIAGTLSILIMLSSNSNRLIRILAAITSVISLLEVATIRARLATIILIIIYTYIIIKWIKSVNYNNKVFYVIIFSFIFALLFYGLSEYIWDSLTQNKEDDITSGRINTYYDAIDIFTSSPLLGNLSLNREVGWVHNYLLLKLSEYGLIFSLPLLVLFFYIVHIIISGLKKRNIFIPQNYGYIILIISFLVSLGEPTYPFGPGTTNLIPFMLLGISMNSKLNIKQL